MANPNSPTNGQGDHLPLIVDLTGATGIYRGYGAETVSGATSQAKHMGTASMPATARAVAQVAAATATAALAAVASKTAYCAGFIVTGGGATAGSLVRATLALGDVTLGFDIEVPAGAAKQITPLIVNFPSPIPANAVNTAITLSVPSFGAGNTDVSIAIMGFYSA
jgi:hypothetical protein